METMKNTDGIMKNDYKGGFKKVVSKMKNKCPECGMPMGKCTCRGKK